MFKPNVSNLINTESQINPTSYEQTITRIADETSNLLWN